MATTTNPETGKSTTIAEPVSPGGFAAGELPTPTTYRQLGQEAPKKIEERLGGKFDDIFCAVLRETGQVPDPPTHKLFQASIRLDYGGSLTKYQLGTFPGQVILALRLGSPGVFDFLTSGLVAVKVVDSSPGHYQLAEDFKGVPSFRTDPSANNAEILRVLTLRPEIGEHDATSISLPAIGPRQLHWKRMVHVFLFTAPSKLPTGEVELAPGVTFVGSGAMPIPNANLNATLDGCPLQFGSVHLWEIKKVRDAEWDFESRQMTKAKWEHALGPMPDGLVELVKKADKKFGRK